MSLDSLAYAVFFLVFGISYFFPFKYSQAIAAVAAIVVGVLTVVKY